MVGWVTWVMGTSILPIIVWLTEEWYFYGTIVPLFNIILIPFFWLTPESPRLLLTKRKVDQATHIVQYLKPKVYLRKELQISCASCQYFAL